MVQREERTALMRERKAQLGRLEEEEARRMRLRWVERVFLVALVVLAWWIRGIVARNSEPVGLYAKGRLVGIAANRDVAEQAIGIAQERNLNSVQARRLRGKEVIRDPGLAVLALAAPVGRTETRNSADVIRRGSGVRNVVTRPYRVQEGDTGYGIADRLRIPYRELSECNPGKDLGDIQIGEIIRVPQGMDQ